MKCKEIYFFPNNFAFKPENTFAGIRNFYIRRVFQLIFPSCLETWS